MTSIHRSLLSYYQIYNKVMLCILSWFCDLKYQKTPLYMYDSCTAARLKNSAFYWRKFYTFT